MSEIRADRAHYIRTQAIGSLELMAQKHLDSDDPLVNRIKELATYILEITHDYGPDEDQDFSKVGLFLKNITPLNYRYLQVTMQVYEGIRILIEEYGFEGQKLCERFNITSEDYIDFVHGNYVYDTRHISTLNAVMREMRIQEIGDHIGVMKKGEQS